jgi:hypothetical protein
MTSAIGVCTIGRWLYVIRGGILGSRSIVGRLAGRANDRIDEDAFI